MIPDATNWRPCAVETIQEQLGHFRAWCLCAGKSLDWLLGRKTRQHGDTDIGVLRSDLRECLKASGGPRVFLCDPPGTLTPWDGVEVPDRVHDIFVADPTRQHWIIQVMVFDDTDQHSVCRRDPRIRWPKTAPTVVVRGVCILNPLVTILFKLNKPKLADKDCQNLKVLIEELANGALLGAARQLADQQS